MQKKQRKAFTITPLLHVLTALVLGLCACSDPHPTSYTPPDNIPSSVVAGALRHILRKEDSQNLMIVVVSRKTEPLFPLPFMAEKNERPDAYNRVKILEAGFSPREITQAVSSEQGLAHVIITDREEVSSINGLKVLFTFSNPITNQYERSTCKIGFFVNVTIFFNNGILEEIYYWVSLKSADDDHWEVRQVKKISHKKN